MGKLIEVLSPDGELLRYVEVDEKATKSKRSKAQEKINLKTKYNLPNVQMPPKTEVNEKGRAIWPKWLHEVRKEAYKQAKKEGKNYYESDYEGRLALCKAWEAKNGKDSSILDALDELSEDSLMS